jgi:hypothetical protein
MVLKLPPAMLLLPALLSTLPIVAALDEAKNALDPLNMKSNTPGAQLLLPLLPQLQNTIQSMSAEYNAEYSAEYNTA